MAITEVTDVTDRVAVTDEVLVDVVGDSEEQIELPSM